jgi:hypothetical protein
MIRALLAGGASAFLVGVALFPPVLMARWEGRDLTRLGIGIISAGCLLIACGMAAIAVGWRHRRSFAAPSGVRAAVAANVVFLAFFALELSDRLVRQDGRLFYWSTFLFLPAGLVFCGLLAAQRWAWWTCRGAFALGTLWFLGFLAVIPFAHLQTAAGSVPSYGRLYMAGVTLTFANILGWAYWSLGKSDTRKYFGMIRSEQS